MANGLPSVARQVASCTCVHRWPSAALPPHTADCCLHISHRSVSKRLSPVIVARAVAMSSVIQAVL